jgi:hypothetical protein
MKHPSEHSRLYANTLKHAKGEPQMSFQAMMFLCDHIPSTTPRLWCALTQTNTILLLNDRGTKVWSSLWQTLLDSTACLQLYSLGVGLDLVLIVETSGANAQISALSSFESI